MNTKTILVIVIVLGLFFYTYQKGMWDTRSDIYSPQPEVLQPPVTSPPTPDPIPTVSTGIITGRVTISPVCPVEFDPPRPECAPRGYETSILFKRSDGVSSIVNTNTDGYFSINLKAGIYEGTPGGAVSIPSCESKNITVQSKQTSTVNFSCDSGIR